ncbi:MAG: hypothetical protein JOY66_06040 [Acetobacteraceae bacterium]|nr:hypothetical protein [Acetobacteraceae bacterium]
MDISVVLKALSNPGQPQLLFVALLGALVPLSVFVGRRNVRPRPLFKSPRA